MEDNPFIKPMYIPCPCGADHLNEQIGARSAVLNEKVSKKEAIKLMDSFSREADEVDKKLKDPSVYTLMKGMRLSESHDLLNKKWILLAKVNAYYEMAYD